MPVAITYRTTGDWGAGIGVDLTGEQVDANFYNLATGQASLENDRPTPNEIVSLTQQGLSFSFNLENGGSLGPVDMRPLVVTFHFFRAFEPFTVRNELDTFVVDGDGIYATLLAHTTGAEFDAALLVGAEPAYDLIFGFAPDGGSSIVHDLHFEWQGVLSDATRPLVNFRALRPILIPAVGNAAYLIDPASIADQVMPILHDATQIGTLTFVVGANDGTILITADETIGTDEFFTIGLPGTPDATAAGMILGFAARRVIA
jgi:hypothetical protein